MSAVLPPPGPVQGPVAYLVIAGLSAGPAQQIIAELERRNLLVVALADDLAEAALAASLARRGEHAVDAGCYERLSKQELRVLRLIAAGCSNQEIASALLVSVNTIKTHIKRIYEKLQVNNRVGAVERARELGLYR